MHLAFLTSEYPHEKVNHAAGIGTSIKNLVESLVKEGVKVSLFIYGQGSDEVIKENGLTIHLIKRRKYALFTWYFHRKYIERYINKVIVSEGVDVIEAPDWTGVTAFMQFKIPLIIRFHGSDTYFCNIEKRKQKWKNKFFEWVAVRGAQGYISPTSFAGKQSAQLFGIAPNLVETIHYGLNLDNFINDNPEEFQEALIVYIGTIIRKKGVFELPTIFSIVKSKIPSAKLVLIGADAGDVKTGSSSTWAVLKDDFREQDIEDVNYIGKIPYDQVHSFIKKANVCVFPTYAETLGMVTIESMALQRPVVNSNIGWAQELMEDGKSGYLVYPSDHQQYADRIVDLIENKAMAIEMGKEARRYVKDVFCVNKIVKQNISFFNKFIK